MDYSLRTHHQPRYSVEDQFILLFIPKGIKDKSGVLGVIGTSIFLFLSEFIVLD